MGYNRPRYYTLCGKCSTGTDLLDATTYYFGGPSPVLSGSAEAKRMYIPKTGIVREVSVSSYASTNAGSGEAWVISLYDGTTTTAIESITVAAATRYWQNSNMNYPVTKGGYVELVTTTPTFADNPTGTIWYYSLLIECT